jgi:hypothetical protein
MQKSQAKSLGFFVSGEEYPIKHFIQHRELRNAFSEILPAFKGSNQFIKLLSLLTETTTIKDSQKNKDALSNINSYCGK